LRRCIAATNPPYPRKAPTHCHTPPPPHPAGGSLLAAAAAAVAVGGGLLPGAAAQATCVYPLAGTLSGYSGSLSGSLTTANNRLGFNVVCAGALTVPVNTYAALVRIDLPETGSPVTIDTCGSGSLDTIITVRGARGRGAGVGREGGTAAPAGETTCRGRCAQPLLLRREGCQR
jgi:hypothetical protein